MDQAKYIVLFRWKNQPTIVTTCFLTPCNLKVARSPKPCEVRVFVMVDLVDRGKSLDSNPNV